MNKGENKSTNKYWHCIIFLSSTLSDQCNRQPLWHMNEFMKRQARTYMKKLWPPQ
jgi:hypothetical protein